MEVLRFDVSSNVGVGGACDAASLTLQRSGNASWSFLLLCIQTRTATLRQNRSLVAVHELLQSSFFTLQTKRTHYD